jgi:N-acetylneuraminate synthase
MTPKELKDLIKWSEIIYKSKWRWKILTKEEKSCSKFAFATVVAIKDIKKWEKFTTKNIWVKRPWIWEIKAEEYENILWKTSKKDIKKDKHLSYEDIL